MSELVSVTKLNYEPEFNEETGLYYDVCPYEPYKRNQPRYECKCRAGSGFTGRQAWKLHIKNKSHQDWLKDYNEGRKEINDIKEENKKLRGEIERYKLKLRQFVHYKKRIETLLLNKDKEIDTLKKQIDDYEDFEDALTEEEPVIEVFVDDK